MAKIRSKAFLEAWYGKVKPWMDRYLPGVVRAIHLRARGEAGGRSRWAGVSGLEKMALQNLTAERAKDLRPEELLALHRRCHDLWPKAEGGGNAVHGA
jgi:hypothetical protein